MSQYDLDFLDVNLDNDNLLFIDPRLIELSTDSDLVVKMQTSIEVFWAELIKSVRAKDPIKVKELMNGLSEPKETRLGYSVRKSSGNSVANKLKKKILEAIVTNKAVKSGVLSHFCDTEFLIESVKSDRISDITTKIIKSVLIEYTQEQCRKHAIPMEKTYQKDIFNPTTLTWDRASVELPTNSDKAIIFIPKYIVRTESGANSNMQCLYRYAIRHFVKKDADLLVGIEGSGKKKDIQLKDIKQKFPISKRLLTEWIINYGSLLVDYKSYYLNERIRPLTDSELVEILYNDDSIKKAS